MMLSRFAENAFWMGRYVERVESLCRLMMVTEIFAGGEDSTAAWTPVLQVFSNEEAFHARGKPLTALNVVKFYLNDRGNPNSVNASIHMLKENARSLRHLISTESWRQITIFHQQCETLRKRRFALSDLAEIGSALRNSCFTHRGVIDATWYRDEVWRFNRLGAALERADQMTRLIDMKYFEYDREDDDQVAPPDVAWWNTLLRSASGYHAFQRRYSFDPQPADAAGFLLFDRRLPLSVAAATSAAAYQLQKISAEHGSAPGAEVDKAAIALEALLATPPKRINGRPLHGYLDQLQRAFIDLANALNDRYFSPTQ